MDDNFAAYYPPARPQALLTVKHASHIGTTSASNRAASVFYSTHRPQCASLYRTRNSPDMNLLVYSAADVSDVTLNLKQFCNLGHVFHHMSTSSASPCPALFVANLGLQCTEAELNQLFSRCSGFWRLKKWSTYGTAVARHYPSFLQDL